AGLARLAAALRLELGLHGLVFQLFGAALDPFSPLAREAGANEVLQPAFALALAQRGRIRPAALLAKSLAHLRHAFRIDRAGRWCARTIAGLAPQPFQFRDAGLQRA